MLFYSVTRVSFACNISLYFNEGCSRARRFKRANVNIKRIKHTVVLTL